MNKWFGEPVPVSQLPGRGILRIYVNNLVIKTKYYAFRLVTWGKTKKGLVVCHQAFFIFPWENKKVLVRFDWKPWKLTGSKKFVKSLKLKLLYFCFAFALLLLFCWSLYEKFIKSQQVKKLWVSYTIHHIHWFLKRLNYEAVQYRI